MGPLSSVPGSIGKLHFNFSSSSLMFNHLWLRVQGQKLWVCYVIDYNQTDLLIDCNIIYSSHSFIYRVHWTELQSHWSWSDNDILSGKTSKIFSSLTELDIKIYHSQEICLLSTVNNKIIDVNNQVYTERFKHCLKKAQDMVRMGGCLKLTSLSLSSYFETFPSAAWS